MFALSCDDNNCWQSQLEHVKSKCTLYCYIKWLPMYAILPKPSKDKYCNSLTIYLYISFSLLAWGSSLRKKVWVQVCSCICALKLVWHSGVIVMNSDQFLDKGKLVVSVKLKGLKILTRVSLTKHLILINTTKNKLTKSFPSQVHVWYCNI